MDAFKGNGSISAVSILARICPIERFPSPEQLIGFAGLVPGIRQLDEKSRGGCIGGGGTDLQLRRYLIEATNWERTVPCYKSTYWPSAST